MRTCLSSEKITAAPCAGLSTSTGSCAASVGATSLCRGLEPGRKDASRSSGLWTRALALVFDLWQHLFPEPRHGDEDIRRRRKRHCVSLRLFCVEGVRNSQRLSNGCGFRICIRLLDEMTLQPPCSCQSSGLRHLRDDLGGACRKASGLDRQLQGEGLFGLRDASASKEAVSNSLSFEDLWSWPCQTWHCRCCH